MDAAFCVEALQRALSTGRQPKIFNTDQGSQFTSEAFTGLLTKHGIAISMDGVLKTDGGRSAVTSALASVALRAPSPRAG
jgi:hypothetical protein